MADEDTLDSGYISNGWSITISTGLPVENDSDLGLSINAVPSAPTLNNTLTYTVNVTNYGPSVATNVIITDILPTGAAYVTNSCNCASGTNGVLSYTASTLAVGSGVSFSFSVTPTALGFLTNIASAFANEPDPNSNNIQTNVMLVTPTSADMGVAISATPNPVLDGGMVTYTVIATDHGPSAATGVAVVDTLPHGFVPLTITPSQGSASNLTGVITWNVGNLGDLSNATMTVVAGVNLPESTLPSSANLDNVSVTSQVFDPAKLNNFASVKTQVDPAMINVTPTASSYMLSWLPGQGNTALQGAVNLTGPWVQVANSSIVPQLIGGQTMNTFTLPGTNGYHYFRLVSQLP